MEETPASLDFFQNLLRGRHQHLVAPHNPHDSPMYTAVVVVRPDAADNRSIRLCRGVLAN